MVVKNQDDASACNNFLDPEGDDDWQSLRVTPEQELGIAVFPPARKHGRFSATIVPRAPGANCRKAQRQSPAGRSLFPQGWLAAPDLEATELSGSVIGSAAMNRGDGGISPHSSTTYWVR